MWGSWKRRSMAFGLAMAASALALPAAGAGAATSVPGVTATSITTGALASLSGGISADSAPLIPGVRAYFDMVNGNGGVDGRKLNLKYVLDDASNSTQDLVLARDLVQQDHVFAVTGVSTLFFNPNYFDLSDTPTYGYAVEDDWHTAPNLYGAYGSALDYNNTVPYIAWLAKKLKAKSVALMSYGIAVSSNECKAVSAGLTKLGIHVGYEDLNIGFGQSQTSDVQRMIAAHTDFVLSCMAESDNITLSRDIHQYGLKANQLWFNGNDQSLLDEYPEYMDGVYFSLQHAPFVKAVQDPKTYPGLAEYLKTMKKYEPAYTYDELALEGWILATLFVDGLEKVGPKLTQAKVVAATNKISNFTADGITPVTNWTTAHNTTSPTNCIAFVQAQGKVFEPVFEQHGRAFLCFRGHPVLVSAPAGTPGG